MGSNLSGEGEPCGSAADYDVVDDLLRGLKAGKDAGNEGLLGIGLVSLTRNQGGLVVPLSNQLVVIVVGRWRGHAGRCRCRVGLGGSVCERCPRAACATTIRLWQAMG